jgi:hypothetical protein
MNPIITKIVTVMNEPPFIEIVSEERLISVLVSLYTSIHSLPPSSPVGLDIISLIMSACAYAI